MEICPTCQRPVGAKFEPTSQQMKENLFGSIFFAVMVFMLSMGVGSNGWLSCGIAMLIFIVALVGCLRADRKEWQKAQQKHSV